ncbi:MAG TPA: trypsin-like peptidase domain-containing protein [Streptosporangiaceae bacterium]|nr:trypsin-like peptidase domain-containing protein [Streptosporangiaceae bacterium]
MTVDPWRVAQIAVERGQREEGSRGSGYLIAPGRVLTAAHVVAGASAVRVRLDVGQDAQIDVRAENWWVDPAGHEATDLAVITIPETATARRTVEVAQFGRISDGMAVLAVEAFGFPRFKLRADPANADRRVVVRDFEQVTGHAPVAANRRQGTLAVYLDDPPPRQPAQGEASPWEGMSGGPVLAAGRIVGVVAEHHPSEGTGRLTARRIDRAYDELPAADAGELLELLGLAPSVGRLLDVVPHKAEHFVRSAYLAQVRDIAPDALIGREDALVEWAEFCAGPDAYAWWRARPWAGKSALASWFVLHPPAGVDVVSFFITGRLIGQADSDAFLTAMIEQLNALYPAGGRSAAVAGARTGIWWDLLASAAVEAEGRGRRLVVVVDGLDEDEAGATPPRGRPSIASLLPRRPPSGVRFIITSRTDPGLPDDLPADHPLRASDRRRLPMSRVAESIELLAKQELRDLLAGDQVAIDVVGYIAASGGGLTRGDLSALTGAPPHKLEPVLRGVFGRSLYTRVPTEPGNPQADPMTRVYLFAHETLRVTAEEQLGDELTRYREKVHGWIESYATEGWPDTTPGYAIRGYARLLAATADVTRLSVLARDPRRHAFLLDATGSDYTALTEIRTAQDLIAHQKDLDLQALVELASYRVAIYSRNESIPADLAAMWALLGRLDHAEALARTIADPDRQSDALIELAIAIAKSGDLDRAEAIARSITDPDRQAEALTGLVTAVAGTGDRGRAHQLAADAEALARTIADPDSQGWALAGLAAAVAGAGDLDGAQALARTIADSDNQDRAMAGLAAAVAGAGDLDGAQALAHAIADSDQRDWALAGLAAAAAAAGDVDRAQALANMIADANGQADALAGLVTVAARDMDRGRADQLAADAEARARTIADPDHQAAALTGLVTAVATAGDVDRAEALARSIADRHHQDAALAALVAAVARAGDLDYAEGLASSVADPSHKDWALAELVTAAAAAGDLDRAEGLARTIDDPGRQARSLADLATVVAGAGHVGRAQVLADTIADPRRRTRALASLATAIAQAGDRDRAYQLAGDAEVCARATTNADRHADALMGLVTAAAGAGDLDRAEALARTVADPARRINALLSLVPAAARAGDLDRAEALARKMPDPGSQAQALASLVTVVAATGYRGRAYQLAAEAEALVRSIADSDRQDRALAGLVSPVAAAGDLDRAEALARAIADPGRLAWALTGLVSAVAAAGDLDRAEALARAIADPYLQVLALARLITVIAEAEDRGRASRLAVETEALARAIADPPHQARALASLTKAIADAGDRNRASQLAADTEALARAIADLGSQAWALVGLVAAAAEAGDLDRAEDLARSIDDPTSQAWALTSLVTAAAEAGDLDRAEDLARAISHAYRRAQALAGLVSAVAAAGDLDRAEALARSIADPENRAEALVDLVTAAAQAGDFAHAAHLLATVLVMDVPETFWISTVSRLFPSAMENAWHILTGVFIVPGYDQL